MKFWIMLANFIAEKVADRIADEVILITRKKARMSQLDKQARELKDELAHAQSTSEREAVLDKVHALINGFDAV